MRSAARVAASEKGGGACVHIMINSRKEVAGENNYRTSKTCYCYAHRSSVRRALCCARGCRQSVGAPAALPTFVGNKATDMKINHRPERLVVAAA
jgi:hypothetical protein